MSMTRDDADNLVQRYHNYAQTHLPSDNKRELVSIILHAINQATAELRQTVEDSAKELQRAELGTARRNDCQHWR